MHTQYTKLIQFVLCWPYSPELSLESSGYTQGHHIEHNCFPLLPSVSIADSFLVSSINKCLLLISVLGSIWLESVLGLLPKSVQVYMYLSPIVPGRYCFLEAKHHLQIFHSLILLYHIGLWTLRAES